MKSDTGVLTISGKRHRAIVAAGVTLLLATLAGLGAWQIGLHGRSSGRVAPAPSQGSLAAAPDDALEIDPTVSSVRGSRGHSDASPQLVLVGSAEQATEANRGIEAANVLRAQYGLMPLPATVLQIASTTSVDAMRRAIADENTLRASLALTEIQLDDLR